ncbi:conserved hypothetical protein [Shigella dysenteriae 1617]|uniref:Transposase n=1 Tax=Shigella dysenteriae WRSd3 TaxID=1401327 RepID=A0A090N955_SHIDY|nr:conserved hypothetical protein [Shigella dysenteriae 1617]EFP74034.1 conserved hypothetical protein [Shigella dysenteriae 1617]ESU75982.1 hypothetical protein WRSd3_p00134 [Shigella dysenteriae WRSd3]
MKYRKTPQEKSPLFRRQWSPITMKTIRIVRWVIALRENIDISE